jgi:hypothetical protein
MPGTRARGVRWATQRARSLAALTSSATWGSNVNLPPNTCHSMPIEQRRGRDEPRLHGSIAETEQVHRAVVSSPPPHPTHTNTPQPPPPRFKWAQ